MDECPVTFIDDWAEQMVQWFVRVQIMHKSFGSSNDGGDLSQWDARDVDAFVILQQQENMVDRLMIQSDRKR